MSFDIASIKSRIKNRKFTELPLCALCGSANREPVFTTDDGNPIAKCLSCGLHYTSPRPSIQEWQAYLQSLDSERNKRVTENRIKFGVANENNASKMPKHWRRQLAKKNRRVVRSTIEAAEIPVYRLHDVGCGVGFLLCDARDMGLDVSGNDLNRYACEVMKQRYNLNVECATIGECSLQESSVDAIVAKDYIEHTWQPLQDLEFMYKYLKPGGVLHIETFHIECRAFDELGSSWAMLSFNHVYHFSPRTLIELVTKAGFRLVNADYDYERILIKLNARKPFLV